MKQTIIPLFIVSLLALVTPLHAAEATSGKPNFVIFLVASCGVGWKLRSGSGRTTPRAAEDLNSSYFEISNPIVEFSRYPQNWYMLVR